MAERDSTPPRETPEVSHEHSDVNIRAILGFGVVLLIAAVVVHIGLYGLFEHYNERSARRAPVMSPPTPEDQSPPPPRLQVSPRTDLAKLRAAEEKELQTYRWVDREKKIVSIPIDRAMELIAERGLPVRKQPAEERKERRGKLQEQKR